MANFRNRYDPLRLFFKRIATLFLLFVVVLAGIGVWRIYVKEQESRMLRAEAEAKQHDLQAQAQHLETETAKLMTDRGKEETLRTQYDVGRKGEGLIVIVDRASTTPINAPPSFFQKVKNWLVFW